MNVRPVLPFVAPPDAPFEGEWITALQAAMPDETVVSLSALDDVAREACTVAVVANPRPEDLRLLPRLRWVHSIWAGVERMLATLNAVSQLVLHRFAKLMENRAADQSLSPAPVRERVSSPAAEPAAVEQTPELATT